MAGLHVVRDMAHRFTNDLEIAMTASTAIACSAKLPSVRPTVYRSILPIASRTCSMRTCQRLSADMQGLPENVVAEGGIHTVARHKVHAPHTQATLQVLLDGNQIEQGDRASELDEHIHIAFRPSLVAGHRAEQ